MRSAAASLWLAAALLFSSCSPKLKLLEPAAIPPSIAGLLAAGSGREALTLSLGPAHARFDGGRVAVWFLSKEQRPVQADRFRDEWQRLAATRYHLVVEYDDGGRVTRHSIIRVR